MAGVPEKRSEGSIGIINCSFLAVLNGYFFQEQGRKKIQGFLLVKRNI